MLIETKHLQMCASLEPFRLSEHCTSTSSQTMRPTNKHAARARSWGTRTHAGNSRRHAAVAVELRHPVHPSHNGDTAVQGTGHRPGVLPRPGRGPPLDVGTQVCMSECIQASPQAVWRRCVSPLHAPGSARTVRPSPHAATSHCLPPAARGCCAAEACVRGSSVCAISGCAAWPRNATRVKQGWQGRAVLCCGVRWLHEAVAPRAAVECRPRQMLDCH